MPALAPIKVSKETDALVSHTAHFLTKSKKSVVEDAVREYIDNHRDEINGAVRDALAQLDFGAAGDVGQGACPEDRVEGEAMSRAMIRRSCGSFPQAQSSLRT